MKIHLLMSAALIAVAPATAWADDPKDPAMRSAAARARDREMTRQLNLEELAKTRRRDAHYATGTRAARASGRYAADEEYSARSRDYENAMTGYADERAHYEREMAAWRSAVAACRAGDYSACN